MNRGHRGNFRVAMRNTARFIFPLMVVVLLVYLASQTLLPKDSGDNRLEYSELIKRVDSSPDSIRKVTFFPNRDGSKPNL